MSVTGFGIVGYLIQQQLIHALLLPAKNQQFIYTSPGGGINFLFQVCIYFGVALSIPIIIYQLLAFFEPVIKKTSTKFLVRSGLFSMILAIMGTAFGYFIGLPSALHFLAHQFTTAQIEALLTIQEYMSFVTIYLVGSALLFQIPLVMLFINRIKPLKPGGLFKIERYVIVLAFIAAAIITPTPDIFNQSLIAGPIIVIYQFGIMLVWLANRHSKKNPQLQALLKHDAEVQAARLQRIELAGQALPLPRTRAFADPQPINQAVTASPTGHHQQKIFLDIKPQTKTMSA